MFQQYRKKEKKMRLPAILFAAGVFLGLLLMYLGRAVLLGDGGIMSESALYGMKYASVERDAFFWYVMQKRVGLVLVVGLLSTTWLGLAAAFSCTVWLGSAMGMLVMAALLRYGLKGILLIAVGVFPQVFVYVPAAVWLLRWSWEFCMTLYFPGRLPGGGAEGDRTDGLLKKRALQFLGILGVVVIGCLLEGYVNPVLVSNLLKIF